MSPRGAKGSRAFTLVELLVGATLSAAIMAAVLSSYIYLGRSLSRLANQQSLETEARRTLAYFAQDVQSATGLTDTANLGAARVSLTVPAPTATGTNTITYYYNNAAADVSVMINGTSVTMTGNALTRCVYDSTGVTSQLLLRNITGGGLVLKYYDGSGREYVSYTNYLLGIKQLALQFSTQTGAVDNGTQTLVYQGASSRLAMRNNLRLQ